MRRRKRERRKKKREEKEKRDNEREREGEREERERERGRDIERDREKREKEGQGESRVDLSTESTSTRLVPKNLSWYRSQHTLAEIDSQSILFCCRLKKKPFIRAPFSSLSRKAPSIEPKCQLLYFFDLKVLSPFWPELNVYKVLLPLLTAPPPPPPPGIMLIGPPGLTFYI